MISAASNQITYNESIVSVCAAAFRVESNRGRSGSLR